MERRNASTEPGALAAALAGVAAAPLPLPRLALRGGGVGDGASAFAFLALLAFGGGDAERRRLPPLAPPLLQMGCGGSSMMRLCLGAFLGSAMPRTAAPLSPVRGGSAGSS